MSTLTKKQQKAQAFRTKQKAKKSGKPIPDDVPEADLPEDEGEGDGLNIGDADVIAESSTSALVSKKRKREAADADAEGDKINGKKGEDLTGGAKGKAKSIGKGKGKAWDEDDGEENGKVGKKSKKEIKQRFILFIGNVGFKTTVADIQSHFKEAIGINPQVRLLTTKPTRAGQQPKSRGIAFLEVPTSENMQAALKLHHTTLNSRRINVELTAGGGGKSDDRAKKIKERNDRVGVQRGKRAEREAEEGVTGAGAEAVGNGNGEVWKPTRVWGSAPAGENAAAKSDTNAKPTKEVRESTAKAPAPAPAPAPQVPEDHSHVRGVDDGSVKVRGGRRVKVVQNGKQMGSRPPPRPRWEPTGSNAMPVG